MCTICTNNDETESRKKENINSDYRGMMKKKKGTKKRKLEFALVNQNIVLPPTRPKCIIFVHPQMDFGELRNNSKM